MIRLRPLPNLFASPNSKQYLGKTEQDSFTWQTWRLWKEYNLRLKGWALIDISASCSISHTQPIPLSPLQPAVQWHAARRWSFLLIADLTSLFKARFGLLTLYGLDSISHTQIWERHFCHFFAADNLSRRLNVIFPLSVNQSITLNLLHILLKQNVKPRAAVLSFLLCLITKRCHI